MLCHRCAACGGLWYRVQELADLLGERFDLGHVLALTVEASSPRACPSCRRQLRAHLFAAGERRVELDYCAACQGFFLDPGELGGIRAILREGPLPPPSGLVPRRVSAEPQAPPPDDGSALAHYLGMDQEAELEAAEIPWSTYFFCLLSQLPVEVHTPRRHFPGALAALTGAFGLVFFLLVSLPPALVGTLAGWLPVQPFFTLSPLGLYTLVTYVFLHANLGHLLGNCYFMWVFGDNVYDVFMDHERGSGPGRFLAFFFTAGAAGGLLHSLLAMGSPGTRFAGLVGASGAVSGLMGAYWRLFPDSRLYQIFFFKSFKMPLWFYMLLWLGGNLLMAAAMGIHSPVSWSCHLGGFLVGYLGIGWFLPYPVERLHGAPPRPELPT